MSQSDPTISISYKVDRGQWADYDLGVQHQTYANYRMIFASGWDRYLRLIRTDLALYAGAAAALVYTVGLELVPEAWTYSRYWTFAPAPVAVGAVWLTLWLGGRRSRHQYADAFAEWNLQFDEMHSERQRHVTIGPVGLKLVTNTDSVELSWFRYHLAIVQPEHLVLVFHGLVVVIPNASLPEEPEVIANKIVRWAEEFAASKAAQGV
jgi:hypothetical protein